jgi:hypothetical protein
VKDYIFIVFIPYYIGFSAKIISVCIFYYFTAGTTTTEGGRRGLVECMEASTSTWGYTVLQFIRLFVL